MTATEAFELTTQGGATDFARIVAACESFGPYCLIGGLAVNCYVEPVYPSTRILWLSKLLMRTSSTPKSESNLPPKLGTKRFSLATDPKVLGVHG